MKKLPIGIQTFSEIITGGFAYVDKTGLIHNLITTAANRFFLSRPRRFGKSLTCSTLEAIFEGRKDLFHGLAISKTDYDWKKYPIVRLDFNGIAHQTIEDMHVSMSLTLDRIAANYEVDISLATLPKDKFNILIVNLAKKLGPVVIIIDEYDKPILDHIYKKDIAEQMRDFLKSFYGVLKDKSVDASLRFLFMTGVSKFSKVSIFSELNNLQDLTMDERYSTLCGYTQDELELVFDGHIQAFAQYSNKTKKEMLDELRHWYNGFQFSEAPIKVYNPFSILNCLEKRKFANYWFASGTPTFLMKLIQNNPEKVKQVIMLESSRLIATSLETFSVETYFENMLVLLLQSGYLTLSSYDQETSVYSLCYANYEIRSSMTEVILNYLLNVDLVEFSTLHWRFRKALASDDIEAFCQTMKDFFVLLPIDIIIPKEKFYHGVVFTVAKLLGADVDVDPAFAAEWLRRAGHATSRGYIDLVLQGKNNTYIFEFKKDKNPDAALVQIEDKQYFAKFKIESTKPIVLVGMNFDFDEKGVRLDWKVKKI